MPVEIVCNNCQRKYRVDSRFVGKKIRCKNCSHPIPITAPTTDTLEVLDDSPALPATPAPRKAPPPPPADDLPFTDPPLESSPDAWEPEPMPVIAPPCPSCGQPLPLENRVCLSCGYNRNSGQRGRTVIATRPAFATNKTQSSFDRTAILRSAWLYAYGLLAITFIVCACSNLLIMSAGSLLILVIGTLLFIIAYCWALFNLRATEYWTFLACLFIPIVGIVYAIINAINNPHLIVRPAKLAVFSIAMFLAGVPLIMKASHKLDQLNTVNENPHALVGGVDPAKSGRSSRHAESSDPSPPGPVSPASFPELPAPMESSSTYEVRSIHLPTGGNSRQNMEILLYLPRQHSGAIPCVFIAPAGTPCIFGMNLSRGDRAEHIPYAQAGMAVAAYSLDGPVSSSNNVAEITRGAKAFMAADGGVQNCRRAIDYVLAKVPYVNPQKLYAAGHSSAGLVALNVLASEPRIRAAVVYCPCVDIEDNLRGNLPTFERLAPGLTDFVHNTSPIRIDTSRFNRPLLMITASNDQNVPQSSTSAFANRMSNTPTFSHETRSGGHYDAMISALPRGVSFLRDH